MDLSETILLCQLSISENAPLITATTAAVVSDQKEEDVALGAETDGNETGICQITLANVSFAAFSSIITH